ncbi:hypothetical protein OG698_47165 [Streptomyces sp. NBC_01003]|uniref:hypothetical protein n=1 Tax=Streptomyces sp. NBC_01003 TaxID=2903714 RepID=UPI00386C1A38|nr:hypothetical protein OG698_47165 [Streptomyces sp. NBC_01003]
MPREAGDRPASTDRLIYKTDAATFDGQYGNGSGTYTSPPASPRDAQEPPRTVGPHVTLPEALPSTVEYDELVARAT